MIAELSKMYEAFRTAVAAARAVMEDRRPVLIEDLEAMGCSCPRQRAVIVHDRGSYCGDSQYHLIMSSLGVTGDAAGEPVAGIGDVLGILAAEADRRDGVIR